MEFQEYPKALYLGEECRIVDGAAGEAVARAEGFRFCSGAEDDAEPVKRGPGRPRKVAE